MFNNRLSHLHQPLSRKDVMKVSDDMTRLELLTLLLSIKALLESDNTAKALELINEVIAEAKHQN